MHLSFFNILAIIFTYVVFGYAGYRISRRFKRPVSIATWLVIVFATFIAGSFMPGAILIGGREFVIHVDEALQAVGVGIIVGLAAREIRIKLAAD